MSDDFDTSSSAGFVRKDQMVIDAAGKISHEDGSTSLVETQTGANTSRAFKGKANYFPFNEVIRRQHRLRDLGDDNTLYIAELKCAGKESAFYTKTRTGITDRFYTFEIQKAFEGNPLFQQIYKIMPDTYRDAKLEVGEVHSLQEFGWQFYNPSMYNISRSAWQKYIPQVLHMTIQVIEQLAAENIIHRDIAIFNLLVEGKIDAPTIESCADAPADARCRLFFDSFSHMCTPAAFVTDETFPKCEGTGRSKGRSHLPPELIAVQDKKRYHNPKKSLEQTERFYNDNAPDLWMFGSMIWDLYFGFPVGVFHTDEENEIGCSQMISQVGDWVPKFFEEAQVLHGYRKFHGCKFNTPEEDLELPSPELMHIMQMLLHADPTTRLGFYKSGELRAAIDALWASTGQSIKAAGALEPPACLSKLEICRAYRRKKVSCGIGEDWWYPSAFPEIRCDEPRTRNDCYDESTLISVGGSTTPTVKPANGKPYYRIFLVEERFDEETGEPYIQEVAKWSAKDGMIGNHFKWQRNLLIQVEYCIAQSHGAIGVLTGQGIRGRCDLQGQSRFAWYDCKVVPGSFDGNQIECEMTDPNHPDFALRWKLSCKKGAKTCVAIDETDGKEPPIPAVRDMWEGAADVVKHNAEVEKLAAEKEEARRRQAEEKQRRKRERERRKREKQRHIEEYEREFDKMYGLASDDEDYWFDDDAVFNQWLTDFTTPGTPDYDAFWGEPPGVKPEWRKFGFSGMPDNEPYRRDMMGAIVSGHRRW